MRGALGALSSPHQKISRSASEAFSSKDTRLVVEQIMSAQKIVLR